MPRVSGLFIYPVKSLRGYATPLVELDPLGFVGDRRFLVVDDAGKFQTQRRLPKMAQVDARLGAGSLTLSAAGAGSISVPTTSDPRAPLRAVTVWKTEGLQAEDCGHDASAWLSDFLGLKLHLVRIGEKFSRPIHDRAGRPAGSIGFPDGYPILVASEASLDDLNNRIQENAGEPVPMDRFRPNLVVTGCGAFAEDDWARVRVGQAVFRNGGPCGRCVVTTTDQLTGERGKEPLKTLATFRRDKRDPTEVNFGTNLIHETTSGTVRLGDEVVVLPGPPDKS